MGPGHRTLSIVQGTGGQAAETHYHLSEVGCDFGRGFSLEKFTTELEAARAGWEKRMARLRGVPVISYHKTTAYLSDWLGTPRTDMPVTLGADGRRVTVIRFSEEDRLNAIGVTAEK